MKNLIKKVPLIFSTLLISSLFLFFGVANSQASTAECTAQGGICATVGGSGCLSGSPIANITCSGGVTCCTNVTPKSSTICCQVSGQGCGEINGSTCPTGMNFLGTGSCSSFSACQIKTSTGSSANTNNGNSITFSNPIGFTTFAGLLNSILNHMMGIIATIAIVFMILGGIMYMMSGGNEGMVTKAKKTWTGAIIGLAIALASPTFLKEIQKILNGGGTGGSAQAWVSKALTLKEIAINVANLLLSILGILGIIALIIGGGMYLTAYGDERKIDTGKKIITFAIIGIVVALSAVIITKQVSVILGAN